MSGPGKSTRNGISLTELFEIFPDDQTAERWFHDSRWPDGAICPHCDSGNVQTGASHPTMPYRCRDCRKRFSVRTGTAMADSKLGYRTWAIAIYLVTTSLKGVSSLKLHRDLNITQKSAWHLAHRIREAWGDHGDEPIRGPVEVDEAFIGGKEKNKHEYQRRAGRVGTSDRIAIVGAKDRATGKVRAEVIGQAKAPVLRNFVRKHAAPGAQVYSDGHGAYFPLDGEFRHKYVQHSVGTYAIEQTHTNGIESFWSMLKRGYSGAFHQMSEKHLSRYVSEFAGRHNQRSLDTAEQMRSVARGLVGKRLQYRELIS
ncbi:MAG: IS1595 family transposase [Chloroflexi bacterium]|nr:IS1595 family transposase [Chloroflexota bacterium]